ncbi:MAG: tRNA glutamyl-Q(34) synthetase GluQRS [Verrucomicrobiales bacterium]
MPWVTRFAPSPTGRLHLGHVFAASLASQRAREPGGKFLLRHEDIDTSRCRDEWRDAAERDLRWLGLDWDGEAVIQSHRQSAHQDALEKLRALGVLYPCFCTRREILDEIARMGGAPQGPDGPLYPGTCRSLGESERERRLAEGQEPAWRINVAKAMELTGPLEWHDLRHGAQVAQPDCLGDAVLARKDAGTSYHLAVVVDDAWQGINLVTRGEDLLPSTHLHRLLQALLGLPVPEWEHHPLVCDADGRRLAKRHDDLAVATLRERGWLPDDVLAEARKMAGT